MRGPIFFFQVTRKKYQVQTKSQYQYLIIHEPNRSIKTSNLTCWKGFIIKVHGLLKKNAKGASIGI